MAILIGFLTFILVLISLFLILLVLVQLPKKEAGVGMAFGAGMSEMLLGAGSGNVLTRITKYTVGLFLGMALLLSVMVSSHARRSGLNVSHAIEEQARSTPAPAATLPPTGPGLLPLPATDLLTTPPITTTTTVVDPVATPVATPASTPPAAPPTNNPGGN